MNNPLEAAYQKHHTYEQKFRKIRGLSVLNNFPSILPKH